MKLFDIEFSYKHCYFKTCLLTRQNGVKNRDKAYSGQVACTLMHGKATLPVRKRITMLLMVISDFWTTQNEFNFVFLNLY